MKNSKVLYLAFILALFMGCNRQQANGTREVTQNPAAEETTKEHKRDNQERDMGAAFIKRLGQTIVLTEEQQSAILKLSSEMDTEYSNRDELKKVRQEFRRTVMDSILTEEQRQAIERNKKD